jgi:hypothetical protein
MKRTPWFDASIKPVRDGIYEVRDGLPWNSRSRHKLSPAPYRVFREGQWRAGWLWEEISIFGSHPSHQWRGLTEPAK